MSQRLHITVDDHVVPQLITSALEAYEVGSRKGKKKEDKLETFGLLWGYTLPERDGRPPRVVVTTATVETSAIPTTSSVEPQLDSIAMKKEIINQYWPHLELVGTFHSHPYDTLEEVRSVRGWQASTEGGDTDFWPQFHEKTCPENPYLVHLIVTVTRLQKKGWAWPGTIENNSGFELSLGKRKIWITSYSTECFSGGEEDSFEEYSMSLAPPILDIAALERRVINGN